jgi:hypothetical protein
MNAQGRQSASTIPCILLVWPPLVLRQAQNDGPIAGNSAPFSAAGAAVRFPMAPIQCSLFWWIASGRSGCRRSCAGHIPRAQSRQRQPTSRASFVSYLHFGRKRSRKFALAFSRCIIPPRIRGSSFRSGRGQFAGKCGTIFAHGSSLNQNKFASLDLASQPVDQAVESKHG